MIILFDKWVSHPIDRDKGRIKEKCLKNQRKMPKINLNCRKREIPKQ
jgi:hypothetical protein